MLLSNTAGGDGGPASRPADIDGFEAAYTSIMRSLPNDRRVEVLEDMREGLEKAAQSDLAAPAKPVSTADFMAGLERQEDAQRTAEIAAGCLISARELAARLNMTPQGLHHALKAKRVFNVRGAQGDTVYPAFFADSRQDRKTLEKISRMLGDLPGAAKWDFFTSPRASLGKRTPLEALARGKLDAVITAAQAFAEE